MSPQSCVVFVMIANNPFIVFTRMRCCPEMPRRVTIRYSSTREHIELKYSHMWNMCVFRCVSGWKNSKRSRRVPMRHNRYYMWTSACTSRRIYVKSSARRNTWHLTYLGEGEVVTGLHIHLKKKTYTYLFIKQNTNMISIQTTNGTWMCHVASRNSTIKYSLSDCVHSYWPYGLPQIRSSSVLYLV